MTEYNIMPFLLKKPTLFLLFWWSSIAVQAQDGYELWLDYTPIASASLTAAYRPYFQHIHWAVGDASEVIETAQSEMQLGIEKLLGIRPNFKANASEAGCTVVLLSAAPSTDEWNAFGMERIESEGFLLKSQQISRRKSRLLLIAKDEKGVLYGTFHLLQLLKQHTPLQNLDVVENPAIRLRLLNHWDNLDGTVERGYAGFSIWNWHQLPEYIDQRYIDYARANASIGINGAVVTNVNANALVFRADYLQKAAALANVFRRYGIKLYLTARFSAPVELGAVPTADPNNPQVQQWWADKAKEIYALIPDFGGFLVKANSEGQPGPQQYGRNHADGANMLADALQPFGGVVMWRAFVYSDEVPDDRAKQAYSEFVPLDGTFRPNVLIQVKNGPIDFQPREPVHPLFGAMPKTPIMMEFQITKEYLGQGTHLVGLANMYEEILQTDTYANGKGTAVADIVDGSAYPEQSLSGIAGVSNIGTARNWTGNLFGQADWYAFGRLAWNPRLKAAPIFKEWIQLTFGHEQEVERICQHMLEKSYQACVQYMTPLGLHHIMAEGHHFGPGPWVDNAGRPDWTSLYYHQADSAGIGFDRGDAGSRALDQYAPAFKAQYADVANCPLPLLLWFHHVSWDFPLSSGRTVWEELCFQYDEGVEKVLEMKNLWATLYGKINEERYLQVAMHLDIQAKEAQWWRDACISYFQHQSKRPLPTGVVPPPFDIDHYRQLSYPYAPGIRPRW